MDLLSGAGQYDLGAGIDICFEKIYVMDADSFSPWDILLRQQYRLATEGKPASVRFMVRMLKANLKARKLQRGYFSYHTRDIEPEFPSRPNADLALLILGVQLPVKAGLPQTGGDPNAGR